MANGEIPVQRAAEGPGAFRMGDYLFKRAVSPRELEQVHRLNYDTFVREIPQHADDGSGRLVDEFHDGNVYFIALDGDEMVGMVCVNDRAPFSISRRLKDPDLLRRLGDRLLEVRLLAIKVARRRGLVFGGLTWMVYEYARAGGYSHLLISGLADRRQMYERLGFVPLGPATPHGRAGVRFVPMVLDMANFPAHIRIGAARFRKRVIPIRPNDRG